MGIKINRKLVPVKAHFFFFFAALGPILPQLNVYGRQLGISAEVMGLVTAALPLFWALAKPTFGYIVDYWPNHRKLVFMMLIATMTGSYCGLWFIPATEIPESETTETSEHEKVLEYVYQMNDTVYIHEYDENDSDFLEKFECHWSCTTENTFEVFLTNTTFINTVFIRDRVDNNSCAILKMDFDSKLDNEVICIPKQNCNLLCFEDEDLINKTSLNRTKRATDGININDIVNKDIQNNNIDDIINKNKNDIDNKNIKNETKELNAIYTTENSLIKEFTTEENNENNSTTVVNKVKENSVEITTEIIDNKNEIPLDTTVDNDDVNKTENDQMKSVDISKETLSAKDIRAKVAKVIHTSFEAKSEGSFYMTGTFWAFVILMCIGTVAFNVANCIGDAVCFDVLGPEKGSAYGSQRAWGTAGYGLTALIGGWLVDSVSSGGRKDFTPAFLLALGATFVDLISCRRLKLPALSSPEDSGKALREVLKIPRVVVFIIFAVVAGLFDSFIIYYMFWFLEDLAEQTHHQDKIKLIEGIVVAGQSFIGEIVFFALSGKIIKRWGYGATMTLSLFCYGVRMALISLIQNPWHLVPLEAIMQGPTYALCYSTIVGYAAHVAPEGYSATVQGIVAGMDDGVGFALGSLVGGQLYGWAGGRGSFRVLAAVAGAAALLHALLFAVVTRNKLQPSSEPLEEGEKMLPVAVIPSPIYQDTVIPLVEKTDR